MRTAGPGLGLALALALALLASAPGAAGQDGPLTPSETAALDLALEGLHLDRSDLRFERKQAPSALSLTAAIRALDDPIEAVAAAEAFDRGLDPSPGIAALVERALVLSFFPPMTSPRSARLVPSPAPGGRSTVTARAEPAARPLEEELERAGATLGAADRARLAALPAEVCEALAGLVAGVAAADEGVARAFARFEGDEARDLAARLEREVVRRSFVAGEPSPLTSTAALTERDIERASNGRLVALASKVDMAALAGAAADLAAAVDRARGRLAGKTFDGRALPPPLGEPPAFARGDVRLAIESPLGPVILGGPGRTEVLGRAAIILDLGGDDLYLAPAGGALGLDGPGRGGARRAAVAIDLAGDDVYVAKAGGAAFGAGLLGVGILVDEGGDDRYETGNAGLGAGLAGVGILLDAAGDDRYEGDAFIEGAGAVGLGLLVDLGGRDRYEAALDAQGFAGPWALGALVDLGGDDLYMAGDRYLHAPLFADQYTSLSQGFAIGIRPDVAGGIGVLIDRAGNDVYVADVYGQGAAYWYGLGLLVDGGGNDRYLLTQYGQGSGIHLAAGCLLERGGNDHYHLASGLGQGGAHDYAAGVLVDRGGNDVYTGSGTAQGSGINNAVGILIEDGGRDTYACGQGDRETVQGAGRGARGTISVGLLLDLGGEDRYSGRGRDGTFWTGGDLGAGLDLADPATSPGGK